MRISDWSSDVCSSDLGFKRRAALGRGLPRLGEPLRKTECDERIMGAPAQKLASPEAEPRQAGRLLPFTQRWRGRRIGRAVRPCLSYDGADRDAQPIFEIVRNEALPGTKIIRLGGPCTRLSHPPTEDVIPLVKNGLIANRCPDTKAEPLVTL